MLIAGVDFSGAKTIPNDTWLVLAEIESSTLNIRSVRNTGSHALEKALAANNLHACGMDFPFSLPLEFIRFLAAKTGREEPQTWQSVAEMLVFISQEDFIGLADDFGREPKRRTDALSTRGAKSPLHKVNPSMLQMTYHGIRLLATMAPESYHALPLQEAGNSDSCALIEVYPAETLSLLMLPWRGYKGRDKKSLEKCQDLRKQIVNGFISIREREGGKFKECLRIGLDNNLKGQLIASDHALDAFVACYTAALYAVKTSLFDDPLDADDIGVLLEGWIYSPRKLAFTSPDLS